MVTAGGLRFVCSDHRGGCRCFETRCAKCSVLLAVVRADYVPIAPVSLTIGGQPAQLYFAGAAPCQVGGIMQINAQVLSNISPGPQQVVLAVGGNDNKSQQVTLYAQ